MIAHLSGSLVSKTTASIIIDNNGIGYEVLAPLSTFYSLPEKNEKVDLHIYTHVREDALILFGFMTLIEKETFRMLISVSGIGPKLAVNILSGIGPEDLLDAIAGKDTARLQSIPGIGKKTAERMALELKDKACKTKENLDLPPSRSLSDESRKDQDDALSALLNLGYPSKTAAPAVEKALKLSQNSSLEEIIKEALRLLS